MGALALALVAYFVMRVPEVEPVPERPRIQPDAVGVAATAPASGPEPTQLDAGTMFVGHQGVAAALGGVAIRCEVGAQLNGVELQGGLGPRVREGWFSTVVPELRGRLPVGGRGQPATFQVEWEAERVGDAVPCTVEWLDQAVLEVEVVDGKGEPAVGALVQGCGGRGKVDASGRLSLTVPVTGRTCWLTTRSQAPPHLGGEARITELQVGETRSVVLYVDPRRREWVPAHQPSSPLGRYSAQELEARAGRMEELAAQASGEEAEVAEAMGATLRRRAELKRVTDEQEVLLDEMKELTAAFRSGDREALQDLDSLTQDLLDNARRKLELSAEGQE